MFLAVNMKNYIISGHEHSTRDLRKRLIAVFRTVGLKRL